MESYTPEHFTGVTAIKSLLDLDTLSPHEFWREHRRKSFQQPELELMMAVLEDALNCYFEYAGATTHGEAKLFNDAEQWFQSKDDEGLFSFESICVFLGIDPDYVRRGLSLFRRGQHASEKRET